MNPNKKMKNQSECEKEGLKYFSGLNIDVDDIIKWS